MGSLRTIALFGAAGLAALALACGGSGGDSDDSADSQDDVSDEASASPDGSPEGSPGADGFATPDGSASASGTATDGSTTSPGGSATPENNDQTDATPTPATPVVGVPFVAAEGEYCDTVSASSPPNTVLGLLKFEGSDVPAGKDVMVAFDGVPGPTEATRAAGGYRVDFGVASSGNCANKNGAKISVVIDGQAYDTGSTVGTVAAFRFDIQN